MRVVAGSHRGRTLAAPKGRGTRPTPDRVREALFDVLSHNPYGPGAEPLPRGVSVIDAFAGSGALGLEALSRGADHATFLETDDAALAAIRANAAALDELDCVTILARDATGPGPAPSGPVPAPAALAFLDPPYQSGLAADALAALAADRWLAAGAVCVVELSKRDDFAPPPGFAPLDERRYGITRIVFLRWDPR